MLITIVIIKMFLISISFIIIFKDVAIIIEIIFVGKIMLNFILYFSYYSFQLLSNFNIIISQYSIIDWFFSDFLWMWSSLEFIFIKKITLKKWQNSFQRELTCNNKIFIQSLFQLNHSLIKIIKWSNFLFFFSIILINFSSISSDK